MTNCYALLLTLALFSFSAWAAPDKSPLQVLEPDTQEERKQGLEEHHFDSLGSQKPNAPAQVLRRQWSLNPKMVLAPVLHGQSETPFNPTWLGLHTQLQFAIDPTSRTAVQLTALPGEGLLVSGSWEYTPRRTAQRTYYGFGAAHKLIAEQQLSNLVDIDQYFLTLQAGYEHLLTARTGLQLEVKTFIGTQDWLYQISLGYVFSW